VTPDPLVKVGSVRRRRQVALLPVP